MSFPDRSRDSNVDWFLKKLGISLNLQEDNIKVFISGNGDKS
jgi:hypothetical protein